MPDSGSGLSGRPDREARDKTLRFFSIGTLLVMIGGCVVLVLGLILELRLFVVATGGLSSMVLAFYLFVRLWPQEEEPDSKLAELVEEALEETKPEPLSPEEYRRQRELAQKMIREKAAPALAKAIRGILRQDEMKRRGK
jgi:hypothetical protein